MRKLKAIIEYADNNYSAYLQGVDGVIGVGSTVEETKKSLEESVALAIELAKEDGMDVPEALAEPFEIEYCHDLTSFLNVYSKIISKAGLEKLTGINQKQLWHYASGKRKPTPETVKKVSASIHQLATDLMNVQFA